MGICEMRIVCWCQYCGGRQRCHWKAERQSDSTRTPAHPDPPSTLTDTVPIGDCDVSCKGSHLPCLLITSVVSYCMYVHCLPPSHVVSMQPVFWLWSLVSFFFRGACFAYVKCVCTEQRVRIILLRRGPASNPIMTHFHCQYVCAYVN